MSSTPIPQARRPCIWFIHQGPLVPETSGGATCTNCGAWSDDWSDMQHEKVTP